MEPIFQIQLDRIKAVAPDAQQGTEALAAGKSQQARTFISEKMIYLGDKIIIPAFSEPERWLNAPAVKNGNPVLHPLASVQANGSGAPRAVPFFIGNFIKEVLDKEKNQPVQSQVLDRSGQPITFADCSNLFDQWAKLQGKTFTVTAETVVPTIKRNRATMVAYETTTKCYTFQEV